MNEVWEKYYQVAHSPRKPDVDEPPAGLTSESPGIHREHLSERGPCKYKVPFTLYGQDIVSGRSSLSRRLMVRITWPNIVKELRGREQTWPAEGMVLGV